jgi:hypothetical protein
MANHPRGMYLLEGESVPMGSTDCRGSIWDDWGKERLEPFDIVVLKPGEESQNSHSPELHNRSGTCVTVILNTNL